MSPLRLDRCRPLGAAVPLERSPGGTGCPHPETPVHPVVALWQTGTVLAFLMIMDSSAPVRSDR
ncbi:hypothetical protein GCM10010394_37170 [Streptomyces crystallinus]|uniref:Uncharacterized protein n=1 Tax=Streptomyces crystallinus TaxID=68191 RepID=A0ABP3R9S0_9ACTN